MKTYANNFSLCGVESAAITPECTIASAQSKVGRDEIFARYADVEGDSISTSDSDGTDSGVRDYEYSSFWKQRLPELAAGNSSVPSARLTDTPFTMDQYWPTQHGSKQNLSRRSKQILSSHRKQPDVAVNHPHQPNNTNLGQA